MATTSNCFAIEGIDAFYVNIETTCLRGIPSFSIIGLGDQAVMEAADRVRASITFCSYEFPASKIIVNLAPGDKKKRGSHYDLAIALTILKESGAIKTDRLSQFVLIGELSLNGYLRPCNGILPMVTEAKKIGKKDLIVPAENLAEARLISDMNIYGFHYFKDVIDFMEGKMEYDDPSIPLEGQKYEKQDIDFSEIKGQKDLINAIVLGVAGGHNILMIGEPGCGKTMIAERIPTIMPTMTEAEALDVTKIQSVKGLLPSNHALVMKRPFRQPHHNASSNSLIGGGNPPQPGEVSLAHNGVLFLDELPEFPRTVLESLRQPLENRCVTISRVNGTCTFPANFMLVAAMNPCPCGYYPSKRCHCSDYEVKQYRNKISGPILERIDIQKKVKPIDYFDLANESSSFSSKILRDKVEKAREIQNKRYKDNPNIFCNSQMNSALIDRYCALDYKTEELLKAMAEKYMYSARVITKMLKLARTCADLRASDKIEMCDMKFTLRCRDLDTVTTDQLYTI